MDSLPDELDSPPDELDSPPDESNELFAPSSSFFGDMQGDGEELGGLGDEDEDLLEREISNLRVEDDLDIEELMNDDDVSPSPESQVADDELEDDDTEERLMARALLSGARHRLSYYCNDIHWRFGAPLDQSSALPTRHRILLVVRARR